LAEAKIYEQFAANNLTKKELTTWLGLKSESSTNVYFREIENKIIGRALMLGLITEEDATPAAKRAESEGKTPTDDYEFADGETGRLNDRQLRMQHAAPGGKDTDVG